MMAALRCRALGVGLLSGGLQTSRPRGRRLTFQLCSVLTEPQVELRVSTAVNFNFFRVLCKMDSESGLSQFGVPGIYRCRNLSPVGGRTQPMPRFPRKGATGSSSGADFPRTGFLARKLTVVRNAADERVSVPRSPAPRSGSVCVCRKLDSAILMVKATKDRS